MKATEKVKDDKGYITISDETGEHASFVREVNETDLVKLKKMAKDEAKRVTDLYAMYKTVTKLLLNKPIDLNKAVK